MSQHCQGIEVVAYNNSWLSCHGGAFEVIKASNRLDQDGGNSELLTGNLYHHCTLDSQTCRELHGKSCSLPGHRLDFYSPSKAGDAITNDVQPNASTTLFTQHFSRRKTRPEDQIYNITFTQHLIRTN